MRGHSSLYRRLDFEMELVSARDPQTGETRVTRNMFRLKQSDRRPNECQIELLRAITGPQHITLRLRMNIYSREFQQGASDDAAGAPPRESFYGTAEALIQMFVTQDPWLRDVAVPDGGIRWG